MILSTDAWRYVYADRTCGTLCRSPAHLRDVMSQFDVARAARYQPRDGETFCNAFVWDATAALACEVPHWLYGAELSAVKMIEWLSKDNPAGWEQCDLLEATSAVHRGEPVVIGYDPPDRGHGHLAMGLPGIAGDLRIAQAGKHCLFDAPISAGFGTLSPLLFFLHP